LKKCKNKKVALVALARKFIIQLNAIVRNALIRERERERERERDWFNVKRQATPKLKRWEGELCDFY
jgi:hypothetical protein